MINRIELDSISIGIYYIICVHPFESLKNITVYYLFLLHENVFNNYVYLRVHLIHQEDLFPLSNRHKSN